MSYGVTREALVARFGEGEIVDLAGAEAQDPRIAAAAADVGAAIDSVLARSWALPLPGAATAYPLLTAVALDLARERLYDEAAPAHVAARAQTAREVLQELVGGTRDLVTSDGELTPREPRARFAADERAFRGGAGGELEGLDNF